ncbi:phosphoribosylformylglycinamidine synthase subunit PurQ, partial [Methanocorpusculaceae archaeon]|nr:phosphoribosylformylglycinamidine synthase subunit PurQ [Methanocorpusculaceae archaeon]
SESQERMAVVVEEKDAAAFIELAKTENLEATIVARVTAEPQLVMRWNGDKIVDISREFLNSNGAAKHTDIEMAVPAPFLREVSGGFAENLEKIVTDINACSRRGLSERFDSTIGAGTVLMPFGGKYQQTPVQAMVNKISVEKGDTDDCSLMAWGYNPYIAEKSPFHASYLAVVESVSKLVATGAEFSDVYLSLQEFFEKLGSNPLRWGKPAAALLGAFKAQMGLGIGAIGGKDSMSGSFEQLDVPPTLVSFAVTTEKIGNIISNDLKGAGHKLCWIRPEYDAENLPTAESLKAVFAEVTRLMREGKVLSCSTPAYGGVAEAVFKAALGNGIGVSFENVSIEDLFGYAYGSFILEMAEGEAGVVIGETTAEQVFTLGGESVSLPALQEAYEAVLEPVYPCNIKQGGEEIPPISYTERNTARPRFRTNTPRVLIPVFPGTNCEYDSAKAVARAGAVPEIFIINNLTAEGIAESAEKFAEAVARSQAIFIPGGFSGGDEPDGSGKFITAFFRNETIKNA